jgi:hypothetical protein
MSSAENQQHGRAPPPSPFKGQRDNRRLSAGEYQVSCTIRDIARLAGVSTATVSRVTSGSENVSCKAKSAVLTAIARLQYSPNTHAAELGRAKGPSPRKRKIQTSRLARTRTKLPSDSTACAQHELQRAEQLSLLEAENSRLRELVNRLSKEITTCQRSGR